MKFDVEEVRIEPGEAVVGYSDGVTEANAPDGDFFTRKRLISLLEQPAPSASHLLERIKTNLFLHIGDAKPFDDITMIALRRTPIKL
jgi:sigma-B regulation protein RsbU (phosphoserine phosphatase)